MTVGYVIAGLIGNHVIGAESCQGVDMTVSVVPLQSAVLQPVDFFYAQIFAELLFYRCLVK